MIEAQRLYIIQRKRSQMELICSYVYTPICYLYPELALLYSAFRAPILAAIAIRLWRTVGRLYFWLYAYMISGTVINLEAFHVIDPFAAFPAKVPQSATPPISC